MTEWEKWKKAATDIAKENELLHDTGEFGRDEFIITPPVPEPCIRCKHNIDNDCVMDMCYQFDKFE